MVQFHNSFLPISKMGLTEQKIFSQEYEMITNDIQNRSLQKSLKERSDLFKSWVIVAEMKNQKESKQLMEHFNDLFHKLYTDLNKKFDQKEAIAIFKTFINIIFPTVFNMYRWHETDKNEKEFDIFQALTAIKNCKWYKGLVNSYKNQYN